MGTTFTVGNPFFSALSRNVQDELNKRASYYRTRYNEAGKGGDKANYEFMYRKTAYAQATLTWKGDPNKSRMFSTVDETVDKWYVGKRYLPEPHLSSVEISSDGRYGLLRTAKVIISVYSIEQLESIETLVIVPGNSVRVTYGWSVAKNAANTGEFNGVLYNFSYTVRQDGGFDVTVEAVGRGMFFLHGDANSLLNSTMKIKDKAGKEKIVNSLYTMIDARKTELLSEQEGAINGLTRGNGKYFAPKNRQECPLEFYVMKLIADQEPDYYVTFSSFIEVLNTMINTNAPKGDAKMMGRFNTAIQGNYDPNGLLHSADLEKIALPDPGGMGKYDGDGATIVYDISEADAAYGKFVNPTDKTTDGKSWPAGTVDLGRMLINIETFIGSAQDPNAGLLRPQNSGDDADVSVSDVLNKLFNVISECTGGYYNLTIVTSARDTEGKQVSETEIYIVDTNYSLGAREITPYKLWAFTPGSVLRDIQITSELPAKIATAMYIGGTVRNGPTKTAQEKITGGETVKENSLAAAYSAWGGDPNRPINPELKGVVVETSQGRAVLVEGEAQYRASLPSLPVSRLQKAKDDIAKYVKDIGSAPPTPDVTEGLKAALAAYKQHMDDQLEVNDYNMYPINMSCTMEGVDGIWFGNIVTTNWLPKRYQDSIVFMVTKVTQRVSDGDWTTELETQCRISFKPVRAATNKE